MEGLKQNRINWSKVYEVWDELNEWLDEKLGNVLCPRDCDWSGPRMTVRNHFQNCDNTFRFKCANCSNSKLFTKQGLLDHQEEDPIVKCDGCFSEFHTTHLRFHVERTMCKNKLTCSCDHRCSFITQSELDDHMKTHTTIECNECHITLLTKESFLMHINQGFCPNRKCCKFCGTQFQSRDEMREHVLSGCEEQLHITTRIGLIFL